MTDKYKLSTSVLFLILALVVYMAPSHWLAVNPQTSETIRFGAGIASLLLALLLFWVTDARIQFIQLIREAKIEVMKVVWPTRSETRTFAIMVVLFSIAVAFYCWVADKGIEWVLYDLILRI